MYAPPKSVRCLELGQEFPSVKAAAEALGINRGNIRRSLQSGAPVPRVRDVLLLNELPGHRGTTVMA
eukprot:g68681.t1